MFCVLIRSASGEALLMSTHNICFCQEIRKILCGYPLLSVAMTLLWDSNPGPHDSKSVALICWGLTICQPLWVILCRLPKKGRKEIEEIVEEMKERDREEKGTGMKVKKQKK